MSSRCVEVLICGGGPVGLLTSYQLAKAGLSTYTIEQYDKSEQDTYGRACSLYPRTTEMLDQLDLAEKLEQIAFISRQSATFKDGKRISGRGWSHHSNIHDTYIDYVLYIRQKFSEEVFREALNGAGGEFHSKQTLKDLIVLRDAEDDYKVEAEIAKADGTCVRIRAKYVVGADGGKSTVRHLAKIPFEGQSTDNHWVRIDALVRTNMPDARIGTTSLESSTHGNILWVALDHGRTRIGYAISPETFKEKYGGSLTLQDAIREAKLSLAPFTLEFEEIDWYTCYNFGQRVAATFQSKERILLAGDAGHTHSSGSAQGMNTGVHDAVNLGWKLAGVLKNLYKPEVLETYSWERRAVAQHVINLDKIVSSAVSGVVPESYMKNLPPGANHHDAMSKFLEDNRSFTIGLGVYYEANNILNRVSPTLSVASGHRAPDVQVYKPGRKQATRLYEITKNDGKYWIVVFAGQPTRTGAALKTLRQYLDGPDSFTKKLAHAFHFCTVIAASGIHSSADEMLGVRKFGFVCFDPDEAAHDRYGLQGYNGGIAVIRPDGILGFAAPLDQPALIGEYFEDIVQPKASK